MKISGKLVDVNKREIYPAEIYLKGKRIVEIKRVKSADDVFILPGLIDAHIHIESSMITPGAFAMVAIKHGTCGVVSDPHEIANILGMEGVEFMIQDSKKVPLKFYFGAPSCVPATSFETSGAILTSREIEMLLKRNEIKYLSEMMNFPGVIYNDTETIKKIQIAKSEGKLIDGHAPGLTGELLKTYVNSGISTDHECSTIEEAREKIALGMKILIREGNAAKNLDALKGLYNSNPDMIMLCSDDLHPEMLEKGHINKLISRLISEGFDLFDVIRSATANPVEHYRLDNGLLNVGDSADLILVDSLEEMKINESWIDGKKVFDGKKIYFNYSCGSTANKFRCSPLNEEDIKIRNHKKSYRVIVARDGELLTTEFINQKSDSVILQQDIEDDILKIVVKDRYNDGAPAVGFIKGFGIREGAFACSIAHDSHNIIAIGATDTDLVSAVNEIIAIKGGLAVSHNGQVNSLRLEIGGIMTSDTCKKTADSYERLNHKVKSMGSRMNAPFMTLSFMALLVIPDLKISDKGLFDVKKFSPVPLFI